MKKGRINLLTVILSILIILVSAIIIYFVCINIIPGGDNPRNSGISNLTLNPLFPENNIKDADRINLVFVLIDFPEEEYIVNWVKDSLGFDNGTQIFHIDPYDYFSDKENSWIHVNESNSMFFTLFAIEPIRSNKDKFNLWYYYLNTDYNQSEVDDFLNKNLYSEEQYFSSYKLKYVAPIIIQAHPIENDFYSRQGASLPSFYTDELTSGTTINKSNLKFGLFYDYYGVNSSGTILSSSNELTSYLWMHESAHSIFGLLDEYPNEENENPSIHYPNCAPNLTEAEAWWGNFENQIDDNYYKLNEIADDFYNSNPNINYKPNILCSVKDIKIGYIYGGCGTYLDSTKVIKPNKDSFMVRASNCPIPGAVNRDQMEKVLNLFSGR